MFAPVATPDSEAELAVIVSLLTAYEIPHFVHNRHLGALYPGNQFPLFTLQRVMVAAPYVADARGLLDPFFQPPAPYETERRLRARDRVRGVFEFFVAYFVVGGKRWRPGDTHEDS